MPNKKPKDLHVGNLPAPYPGPKGGVVETVDRGRDTPTVMTKAQRLERYTKSKSPLPINDARDSYTPTSADYAKAYPPSYKSPGTTASAAAGIIARGGTPPVDNNVASPTYNPMVADLTKNPYGPAYDELMKNVAASIANRGADYQSTKDTLTAQQAAANKDMYSSYLQSRLGSDASSNALGVDPALVSAARDLAMRKSQENSDQALADNLAFVDKTKLYKGDQLNYTQNSLMNDKLVKSQGWNDAETKRVADINTQGTAMQQKLLLANLNTKLANITASAKAKSKSKSGSEDVKVTAKEVQTLKDSGMDSDAFKQLKVKFPEAAALYLNASNLSGTDVSVIKLLQQGVNEAEKDRTNPSKYTIHNLLNPMSYKIKNVKNKAKADKKVAMYKTALNAAMSDNVNSVRTITSTGKG